MARTESTMLPLGTAAPDFTLPEPASGKTYSLASFTCNKALLVVFMCNHCPYVLHIHRQLNELIREYQPRGLAAVGINANDVTNYPDDSPEKMVIAARENDYCFPYLYDEDQSIAKAYMAACTPDFYLFDEDMHLAYRGQFDDARPRNDVPVTGNDLRAAIEAVLSGENIDQDQRPSMGCNIKWRPGNEPGYFG